MIPGVQLGLITYVEIADENLVPIQIIPYDESRDFRIHDPMQHSNLVAYNFSKICVEVYRHHSLVFHMSEIFDV
jgi:hypothetical protein